MSRRPTYLIPPTARVVRIILPLGALVSLAAGAAWSGDESVLPGNPPSVLPGGSPAATSPALPKAQTSDLQIVTLQAGPAPYAWEAGRRVVASFITEKPDTLAIAAAVRVPGHPEWADRVEWSLVPPAGFQAPAVRLSGSRLHLQLRRPGGNPVGGGEPLALTLTAMLTVDGRHDTATVTLRQDLRDRLRQEYVDLERASVPGREELVNEDEFRHRYGEKYPGVSFAELNWSRQPGKEDRYPAIPITEPLLEVIQKTRELYRQPVVVSSGFRNPVRQAEVHAGVFESHHQYGRAVDLYVAPDSAPPQTGRKIATEGDWLRLAAAAMRAGGAWIEPMQDCHVNTDGCHVHVDVREEGVRTQIVTVAGRVLDAGGNPVPDALVRMAGMPARTNPAGLFTLKHVLVPRDYPLEVEAPGRAVVTQNITVADEVPAVEVRVPADPNAVMVARVDRTTRASRDAVDLRVSLRNVGLSEARGLTLSARVDGVPAQVPAVEPTQVPEMLPSRETSLGIPLKVAGGKDMSAGIAVHLLASYLTATGERRTQDLPITVEIPRMPEEPVAKSLPPLPPVPTLAPQKAEPILGPAAAGVLAGGAAAAVGSLARKKARAGQPAGEPSIDPSLGRETGEKSGGEKP